MSTGWEIMVPAGVLIATGMLLLFTRASPLKVLYVFSRCFFFLNHKDLAFSPWVHSQRILLLMFSSPRRPDGETLLLRRFPEP